MSGPPPSRSHVSSQLMPAPGSTSMPGHLGHHGQMGAPPYGHVHPMNRPQHTHGMGPMYPPMPSPSSRPGMPGSVNMPPPVGPVGGPPSAYSYHPVHASSPSRHPPLSMPSSHHHPYPPPHSGMSYQSQPHHPSSHPPPQAGSIRHGQPIAPPPPPPPPHIHHIPLQSSSGGTNSSATVSSQPSNEFHRLQGPLNGNWHSNSHIEQRKKMIEEIIRILKRKDSQPSEQWLRKLPEMVRQLEVSLYRSASSFEEYSDLNTLKSRLQLLAKDITSSTAAPKASMGNAGGNIDGQYSRSDGLRSSLGAPESGKSTQYSGHHSTGHPYSMQSPSNRPLHGPHYPGYQNGMMSIDKKKVVNMDEINPTLAGSSAPPSTTNNHSSEKGLNGHSRTNQGSKPSGEDADMRTKYKQQRLLLLHHSSQCTAPEGQCTVNEHCAFMKKLWRHMENCSDYECDYMHCLSSRSILRHYRKCEDSRCVVCGPVRDIVTRNRRRRDDGSSFDHLGIDNSNRYRPQSIPDPYPSHSSPINVPHEDDRYGSNSNGFPAPYQNQYPRSSQMQNPMLNSLVPTSEVRVGTSPLPSDVSKRLPSDNSETSNLPNATHWTANDRVLYKQQRLLLLRHASLCTAKEGECTRTSHCGAMKQLWVHIKSCTNDNCTYPHCISSRYVLSHYRKCKDAQCEVCEPVRKSHRQRESSNIIDTGNSSESPPPVTIKFGSSKSDGSFPKEDYPPSKRLKVGNDEPIAAEENVVSAAHIIPRSSTPSAQVSVVAADNPSKKSNDMPYSLINTFTVEEIERHIKSLNLSYELSPAQVKAKVQDLLKGLCNHEHGWVFKDPVNPDELGIPDYFDVIKHPMDLGTISKKLDSGAYHSINDFFSDVRLTFDNAMTYNDFESPVYQWAKILNDKAVQDFIRLQKCIEEEYLDKLNNEKACCLCGFETMLYEPPTLFCCRLNCANQRIRRNSNYYVGGSGSSSYIWCTQCFNDLDANSKLDLPDIQLSKSDLKKKKNDDVIQENWVQCDGCKRWVHYVCGLFNCRQNKDATSKFSCPHCLIKDIKEGRITPQSNAPTAEELPRTKLSDFLETYIRERISSKYNELALEKAESEKMTFGEALQQVSHGGKITIRQVSSTDRKLEVRDRMKRRYAHKNYPEEFPYRCKCIAVFQTLDGVDVILFALYLYEHGENNPSPNTKTVYISYLDSVHFMRPRKLRTFIYHEILIGYLEYARQRGFLTAHIWACPPLKGDDYIFYCKPEDQKTPKDARLRQWYIDMLVECQKRDIVGKITNMYDLYIADHKLDATSIPYLEGDYFCGEAENIIRDLEEGKGGKATTTAKKNKKKKGKDIQSVAKSNKYTRSASSLSEGDDDIDGKSQVSEILGVGERDPVMSRLGEIIKPMKDSFIVAFLNSGETAPENLVVPKEIYEARETLRIESMKAEPNGITIKSDDSVRTGSSTKIIDDDREDIDSEILNNRQAFLNLCRGNNYQFDQLRRAKYSSMMILWHLHNRDAPKFVQQCGICRSDLLSGYRYHCSVCPDFDICEECYRDPNANRGACTHELVSQPIDGEVKNGTNSRSQLTEEQRRNRQEMTNLHIQLIEHASLCEDPNCRSSNCPKMKKYLSHHSECKVQDCKICKRIWGLLRIHAEKCKKRDCRFPYCLKIRERFRQLAQQQQAMDDRRRQEMNRHYGKGSASSEE